MLTLDRDRVFSRIGVVPRAGPSDGSGSLNIERTDLARERLGGSLGSLGLTGLEDSVTIGDICSSQVSRKRRRERQTCTSRSACSTFTLVLGNVTEL